MLKIMETNWILLKLQMILYMIQNKYEPVNSFYKKVYLKQLFGGEKHEKKNNIYEHDWLCMY